MSPAPVPPDGETDAPIPDWQFAAREEDRIAGAVAAARVDEAAKERARIVKLLLDEARRAPIAVVRAAGYRMAADLIERGSGVPEGDTE